METILKLDDVNVTYVNKEKEVYAVRNASFSIEKGDSLGVVGESGSGKSTLANALLRLHNEKSTLISGAAEFEGKDLIKMTSKEMNELRWKEISVVFQKAMNALSPVHRIGRQVEDIYHVREPQRVAIAISLLHKPKLIIFDEATTALDVVTQGQILQEVVQMEKEMDMTRIMITHDMSVVAASCNKVAVMYAGEFMEIGRVEYIFKNPMHPYTQGLLNSFPSLKGENERLHAIPGFLPDLSRKQEGCIFAPRCPKATEQCFRKKPQASYMEDGRMVSCWLYERGGVKDGE